MGRGALFVDYDNDGDQDMLLVHLNSPARLLRNDGGNTLHHWLTIDLRLPNGRTPAIGARLVVTTPGLRQVHEYVAVQGYLAQNDVRAHFGLGGSTSASVVEIRWPDGRPQRLENVPADRILKVVQDAK